MAFIVIVFLYSVGIPRSLAKSSIVLLSTSPVTVNPFAFWKRFKALAVPLPKIPSIEPGEKPLWAKRACKSETERPRSPKRDTSTLLRTLRDCCAAANFLLFSFIAAKVSLSTLPVADKPFCFWNMRTAYSVLLPKTPSAVSTKYPCVIIKR